MTGSATEVIHKALASKSDKEILAIWVENNRAEWVDETFDVIRTLLTERGIDIPPQGGVAARSIRNDRTERKRKKKRHRLTIWSFVLAFIPALPVGGIAAVVIIGPLVVILYWLPVPEHWAAELGAFGLFGMFMLAWAWLAGLITGRLDRSKGAGECEESPAG